MTDIHNHRVYAVLENGVRVRLDRASSVAKTYDEALAIAQPLLDAQYAGSLLLLRSPNGTPSRIKHIMVRSVDDPNWYGARCIDSATEVLVLTRGYKSDSYAAKKVLRPLGYEGHGGGWIKRNGRIVGQGWAHIANTTGHEVFYTAEGYRAVERRVRP